MTDTSISRSRWRPTPRRLQHVARFFSATVVLGGVVVSAGACSTSAQDTGSTSEESSFLSPLDNGTCAPSRAAGAVPRFQRAMLDLIATTEGTYHRSNDGYDIHFNGGTFADCTQHPGVIYGDCNVLCSNASGRYQFLKDTWDGLGLPNFYPNYQDIGAVRLITGKHQTPLPTDRALTYDEFVRAMYELSCEWASLPSGRCHYGQPSVTIARAWAIYSSFVAQGGGGADLGQAIVKRATDNVGKMACDTTSTGGQAYGSSCTGNGGRPEYWCADFAKWVWQSLGLDVGGLTAGAGSFYVYGQNHGTLSNTPHLGDAVVFNYQGNAYADHVAIVSKINGDGTIETISGDWCVLGAACDNMDEAEFSSKSKVVVNTPDYSGTVGSRSSTMGGYAISGFISPAGSGNGGDGGSCGVLGDGKLHCTNTSGAAMHAAPNSGSTVVNHLRSTYSWFSCWGTGEQHAGGNTTWYYTEGDDNGNWGWVPAVDLNTASSFDANPSAQGLAQCGSTPPTTGGGCSVHSDGKLYCGNASGASLYASPSASSGVVNHLHTTYSWFSCWGTGDMHAGGNTTWYNTVGDDNGNSGWVPAVNLDTSSSFDANPSAQGLQQCGGGNGCSVHSNGKLYCNDTADSSLYATPSASSGVVNHLRSSYSWFDCWGTGDMHAGGNTTWYHTLGDDNGNWGWAPAVDLSTSSSFDANPSAQGLPQCGGTSSCGVHSDDGRLYCGDVAGSTVYASPSNSAGAVNHLRTSTSWFDCWSSGDMHAGGNTTWYHTLGDDNGNWGWVPAVDLNTNSSFDANPSAQGLHQCQ